MFKQFRYILGLGFLLWTIALSTVSSASQSFTLPSGEVLLDPTAPYGAKPKSVRKAKAGPPKLTVNYIMSAGDSKRAMINGKKVYEGDYVSGAQVKKIDPDSVSLVYKGKELVLRLNTFTKIRK